VLLFPGDIDATLTGGPPRHLSPPQPVLLARWRHSNTTTAQVIVSTVSGGGQRSKVLARLFPPSVVPPLTPVVEAEGLVSAVYYLGLEQTKFAASSVLPVPVYCATCEYGQSGRVIPESGLVPMI
jgi:hypothetical protein